MKKTLFSILLSVIAFSAQAEVYEMKCVSSPERTEYRQYDYTAVFDDEKKLMFLYTTQKSEFNKIWDVTRKGPYVIVTGQTNYNSEYSARFFVNGFDYTLPENERKSEQIIVDDHKKITYDKCGPAN